MSKATKTKSAFRMDCAITTTIRATPERIWALLTDAAGFPRWNSTVSSMEGTIAEGQRLALKVPAAGDRVFKPKVSNVESGRSMIWSDGMAPMFKGVRTFTLTPNADGSTEFSMREEFSGLLLPMIRGSLPDFAPVFETYAADLKRAAEAS
ncbi:MAG: SRPBCC family protein [Polyangiales bacterium]